MGNIKETIMSNAPIVCKDGFPQPGKRRRLRSNRRWVTNESLEAGKAQFLSDGRGLHHLRRRRSGGEFSGRSLAAEEEEEEEGSRFRELLSKETAPGLIGRGLCRAHRASRSASC